MRFLIFIGLLLLSSTCTAQLAVYSGVLDYSKGNHDSYIPPAAGDTVLLILHRADSVELVFSDPNTIYPVRFPHISLCDLQQFHVLKHRAYPEQGFHDVVFNNTAPNGSCEIRASLQHKGSAGQADFSLVRMYNGFVKDMMQGTLTLQTTP